MCAQTNREFATCYFWRFFLIQPFDLPERMLAADPDHFLDHHRAGQSKVEGSLDPRVAAEYRRSCRSPATATRSARVIVLRRALIGIMTRPTPIAASNVPCSCCAGIVVHSGHSSTSWQLGIEGRRYARPRAALRPQSAGRCPDCF